MPSAVWSHLNVFGSVHSASFLHPPPIFLHSPALPTPPILLPALPFLTPGTLRPALSCPALGCSVYDALEPMSHGTHRLLVPLPSSLQVDPTARHIALPSDSPTREALLKPLPAAACMDRPVLLTEDAAHAYAVLSQVACVCDLNPVSYVLRDSRGYCVEGSICHSAALWLGCHPRSFVPSLAHFRV